MSRALVAGAIACVMAMAACERPAPSPRDILLEARAVQPDSAGDFKPIGREQIADLLARIGEYDEAVATARQDTGFFWMYYMNLARIRAMRGDAPGADSMLTTIISAEHLSRARTTLAADVAERGDTVDALRIVRNLPAEDVGYVRLAESQGQIQRGDLAHAESTLVGVARTTDVARDWWADLAEAYYGRGDEVNGDRVARGLGPSPGDGPDLWWDKTALVARKDLPAAIAMVNARPPSVRSEVFTNLAWEMAVRKDTVKASQALDLAGNAALDIKNEHDRLWQLADVVRVQRQLGLPPSAAALMVVPASMRSGRRLPQNACEIASFFVAVGRSADVADVKRRAACPEVEGFIQGTTAKSDVPEALRLFGILETKGARYDGEASSAAQAIVREMARTDPAQALKWSRARRTSLQKQAALTELARVLIMKQDSTAVRPLPAR